MVRQKLVQKYHFGSKIEIFEWKTNDFGLVSNFLSGQVDWPHEKSRIKNYFIGPNLVKSPIKIAGHGRKIGAMLCDFAFTDQFE